MTAGGFVRPEDDNRDERDVWMRGSKRKAWCDRREWQAGEVRRLLVVMTPGYLPRVHRLHRVSPLLAAPPVTRPLLAAI